MGPRPWRCSAMASTMRLRWLRPTSASRLAEARISRGTPRARAHGNSLAAVPETLDLARRAFRVVRQNLFWAFAYNVAGITLAITGVLNPIMAAGAMVLSSLCVIGNSRRLG